MKSTTLPVAKKAIYYIKEPKYLVPVDTETNVNLKIANLTTDIMYQSHNIIKDTITLI